MIDKFNQIFCEVLRLTSEDLEKNPRLGEIDQWDSLSHMNLIVGIEQGFSIELSFEEIVAMKSYEESRAIVEARLNGKQP